MEDHKPSNTTANSSSSSSTRETNPSNSNNSEPVRSRWTPKPEQILILESIFNSGMVNPPKEETVRIRKLLEKFGAVGDANVFYWFQNRRSRSRRRQRQLQAAAAAATTPPPSTIASHPQLYHDYGGSSQHAVSTCTAVSSAGFAPPPNMNCFGGGDVFGGCFSGQMMGVLPHQITQSDSSPPSILGLSHTSNLDFPSGIITVFINGVATQVPEGHLDVRAMFGEEVILVHSSGLPVAFNDYGVSFQSLQHGESYFLDNFKCNLSSPIVT